MQGGQSANPDSEKIAKNREKRGKSGKNRGKRGEIGKKRQKSGRFFHFALGLATLLATGCIHKVFDLPLHFCLFKCFSCAGDVATMAKAVETSKVVLLCMSEKYKDSSSCRSGNERLRNHSQTLNCWRCKGVLMQIKNHRENIRDPLQTSKNSDPQFLALKL